MAAPNKHNEVGLKKQLSTLQLLLYGVGTMLGAGIYVLVGKVAGYAGSLAPLSFLLAGVLAGLTAYSYAQLAPRFPKSGGEIIYIKEATGLKWLSSLVGWGVIFTGFVSAAAIIKGFVGYLDIFIVLPDAAVIIVAVLVLTAIAIWGIGESLNVIGVITLIEVLGLVFVIFVARENLLAFGNRFNDLFVQAPGIDAFAVFQGAFLAFYAFVGFEDLANVAEEAENPKKSMPLAIYGSMAIATFLYILVAVVAVLSLPLDTLAASDAPLALILQQEGAGYAYTISLISLVAVVNGVLAQIIMGSRVLYGMAKEGNAPAVLKKIHPVYRTPITATVFMAIVIAVLAVFVPILELANLTSYIIITVFVFVNLSQVILTFKDYNTAALVLPKFWLPLLGAVLCLVFLLYKTLA